MLNQSIRVFLAKNLNIDGYQAYVALHDCIVTEANEYMAFKRETVQIGNSVYQGFELKARSLRDANGALFYYCPCRCGFVYDANLVPYRPVAVEYVPKPGLVEPQDFELKQYFLDIQRQQRGHQPHLLQQLIENPHQYMLQYQNYMNQHYNRFLHLTAPQDPGQPSHHVIISQVENPQVVEPLQNLVAHNEQQIVAEEEVNVERAGDEVEEQAHIVVDDEQKVEVEVEDQEQIVLDNDEEEEKEEDQRGVVADAEEDEEEEEEFEYEENEEDDEEEREVEEQEHIVVDNDEGEEKEEEQREVVADAEEDEEEKEEEFEYEENEVDNGEEEEGEEEQRNMLPPPLEEQQRAVANEEDEEDQELEENEELEEDEELEAEPEGNEAQQHNAGANEEEEQEGMEISDAEEQEVELEDHEQMEISDDDEEEYGYLLPQPIEEQQRYFADEGGYEEDDDDDDEHMLQAKPIQCYVISSTSSDDSEEDAIYMDDGFPRAVNEWDARIQSQKISSTVKVEGDMDDGENDWSTDSADEDYY